MGVDTKIYIDQHATAEQIFKVMLKVVGQELNPFVFDDKKANFELAPSKNNPWHFKYTQNNDNTIMPSDITYFVMLFQDAVGSHYKCLLHLDVEDEYSDYRKLLNPGATAIWHAIGKRLVDFFGGKMLYSDAEDYDDPDNWYVNEKAKYPARVQGQSGDDRWYQFYSALFNEPILHPDELLEDKSMECYLSEREKKLYEHLQYVQRFQVVKAEADELKEILEVNPEPKKQKLKKI
jgi:hypothetical protein